ncbi:tetratricopeptide repeat protein [Cohnella caldifontis]|uniref:tetratricopeptide repeat protein n=1 Tax=Cohnella caldifontis TaxID=3027471 RepID=UPI0023EB0476|nr:hypothetical protein [Cohnella sp. YIM B05605]
MWVEAYLAYAAALAIWLGIRYRRDWREGVLRWMVAAFLPGAGLLLPPFVTGRKAGRRSEDDFDFEFISVQPSDRPQIYDTESMEKEMNVVPLEEALFINDRATRRGVMIDLLKQDSLEYLDVLQLAVANEDSETSHYAVSAIMEVKRKLQLAIQELSVRYETDKDDPHLLQSYAEVLSQYLKSGFLDERTRLKHLYTYVEIMGQLIRLNPDEPDYYIGKAEAEISLRLLADAEATALRFAERLPLREEAYLMLIKVYFNRRSYEQIRSTVIRMTEAPIRLSNQALSIVRYWLEVSSGETQAKG